MSAAKKSSKAPATKKSAARKQASKKVPADKASAKPAAKPTKKGSRTSQPAEAAPKAVSSKPDATNLIRREAHTPAVFKGGFRRQMYVAFSIEDVREILRKRKEDDERAAKEAPAAAASTAVAASKNPTPTAAPEPAAAPVKSVHDAASLDDILGISMSPSSPTSPLSKRTVAPRFQRFYDLLMDLRREVAEELNMHSSETLKKSRKDDSGDHATSVDAGTDNFDRDFALSLLSSEQEALKEIDAAIERIYKGTYGVCEITGVSIAEERLEAVPFTRFSLEGQRQHELNARRRVQRTGAFLNEGSGENISFGDDDADS